VNRVWHGEKEREVYELYSEDLDRLTLNSKPVISNLTELADEYKRDYAPLIVRIIEDRIKRVPDDQKLPQLYLLDSIIKNHQDPYVVLFQQNIVSVFASVFRVSREKVREQLFKLRGTWNQFFAHQKLNQLDRRVRELDPAWPIMDSRKRGPPPPQQQQPSPAGQPQQVAAAPAVVAPPAAPVAAPTKIHVNPKIVNPDYIRKNRVAPSAVVPAPPQPAPLAPAAPQPQSLEPSAGIESEEMRELKEQLERLKQHNLKLQKEKILREQKEEILREIESAKEAKKKLEKGVSIPGKDGSTAAATSSVSKSSSVKVCKDVREICSLSSSFLLLQATA